MIVVGLSGPSCCGKSTLARHLRLVLPNAAILYQDDFYLPESELPRDARGDANWDCPASFDNAKLRSTLQIMLKHNELPAQGTREDGNNVAQPLLSDADITALKREFSGFSEPVLLLDGILLFHEMTNITDLLHTKILMPFDYTQVKQRRENRREYTTPEGQWVDPPGFFEDVVWPEFLKYGTGLYASPQGTEYTMPSTEAQRVGLWMPPYGQDMRSLLVDVVRRLREKKSNT